ncbi:hypothetical protein GGR52DRAFT_94997, partial [Hypoxylon sp. FL1284]
QLRTNTNENLFEQSDIIILFIRRILYNFFLFMTVSTYLQRCSKPFAALCIQIPQTRREAFYSISSLARPFWRRFRLQKYEKYLALSAAQANMPGRKGYDMTYVSRPRDNRPQEGEETQKSSDASNNTGPDDQTTHLAPPSSNAPNESLRLSPGYTTSSDSRYAVYNRTTGRAWLRGARPTASSVPITEPSSDQSSSTGTLATTTRVANDNDGPGHQDRRATHDSEGTRIAARSVAIRRALDRAWPRPPVWQRPYPTYQFRRLRELTHRESVTAAPDMSARGARREANDEAGSRFIPAVVVTAPSEGEEGGDDDGVGTVDAGGKDRGQQSEDAC